MVAFRALVLLASALYASAMVLPRQAPGTQFITGPCTSDADCKDDCCAFTTGRCAGPVIAQERDGGCGFGDQFPNNRAAQRIQGPNALRAPGVPVGNNGNTGNNNAPAPAPAPQTPAPALGTQFITGVCTKDADCASACCGFNTGKCAGPVVAQERDGGCGFGDAQPNDTAARAFRGNSVPAPAPQTPAPARGTQFITGVCSSDADCASSCCGFNTGKCAGPVIAQERDGGCGFGDAQPNDLAAVAFRNGQQ